MSRSAKVPAQLPLHPAPRRTFAAVRSDSTYTDQGSIRICGELFINHVENLQDDLTESALALLRLIPRSLKQGLVIEFEDPESWAVVARLVGLQLAVILTLSDGRVLLARVGAK